MAAGAQRYSISETNPNDSIGGGGGCLCGENRNCDRGGPYIIFPAVYIDSRISPAAVVCAPCVSSIAVKLDADVELIKSGHPVPVVEAAVEAEGPARHENPVTEGQYPDLDALDDEPAI